MGCSDTYAELWFVTINRIIRVCYLQGLDSEYLKQKSVCVTTGFSSSVIAAPHKHQWILCNGAEDCSGRVEIQWVSATQDPTHNVYRVFL